MINAVGASAEEAFMATLAGVSMYQESPLAVGPEGPIKMALLPEDCLPDLFDYDGLTSRKDRYLRMLKLAKIALEQAAEEAKIDSSVPVLIGLPERRKDGVFPALEPFLKDLALISRINIQMDKSRVFPSGRASGLEALKVAEELLNAGVPQAMVLAVDSYMDFKLLAELAGDKRLLFEGSFEGMVPAEGAAAIVVEAGGSDVVEVGVPAIANEVAHYHTDDVCTGDALTEVIACATDDRVSPISQVYCCFNGESIFAKEWGYSLIRNSEAFSGGMILNHPAECYGEIGAATGITLVVMAYMQLARKKDLTSALVWAASDGEKRGAVLLQCGSAT